MSVTPEFIGQFYKKTPQGNMWRANSTTPGDWTLEVQNAQFMWEPDSINFFGIISLVFIGPVPSLTSFTINLTTNEGGIKVSNIDTMLSLSFPFITSVDPLFNNTGTLEITGHLLLSTLNLPLLSTVGWQVIVTGNAALTTLSLPSFVTGEGGLIISSCTSLATLSLPVWIPFNGSENFFTGNALNAASVNGILARGVANAGFVSGKIHTYGGTNAAPTGQGVTDKNTLIARGVEVTTN